MRAVLCCAAVLAGCAQEPVLPRTVQVPVPVPCVKAADVPALPLSKPNAELAKLGDEALILTIAAERLLLLGYALKASAVLEGCAAR